MRPRRFVHLGVDAVLTSGGAPTAERGVGVAERSRALNHQSYGRFAALVLARRDEIGHADPEFAVRFGLTAVYATSHELLLFADTGLHPNGMSDGEVAAALTDLYLRILRVAVKGSTR